MPPIWLDTAGRPRPTQLHGHRAGDASPLQVARRRSAEVARDTVGQLCRAAARPHVDGARLICTPDGVLVGQVGSEPRILPGNFIAPHGLCVSPGGDLYVGEAVVATGAARRLAPLTPHCFQKFVRRRD